MTSIFKLIKKATNEKVDPRLQRFVEASGLTLEGEDAITKEEAWDLLGKTQEAVYAQFTGTGFDGTKLDVPELKMTEALTSSDVSIIFPRVISTVLLEPTEPNLFLMNNVAETMELGDDAPLSIEFPTVGYMYADEMSEGGEYPAQQLGFQQFLTTIRLRKIGIASSVTEETIARSMWPIVNIQLRQMANAINRRVEQELYKAMIGRAQNVFDNESSDSDFYTTGKAVDQTANYSFSYFDLVKMVGVLLGNRYEATHFLAHPLAWPIFAQDPIIRAQFYHGGQMGGSIWTTMPKYDQTTNFPFGMSYVPYYALTFTEQDTLTGVASGEGASLTTDVYVIDARNSLFMATRGGIKMDNMDNWYRDATMLKARRYVGVSAKDGGKGMVSAKNIRVVRNEEAIFTVNTNSV